LAFFLPIHILLDRFAHQPMSRTASCDRQPLHSAFNVVVELEARRGSRRQGLSLGVTLGHLIISRLEATARRPWSQPVVHARHVCCCSPRPSMPRRTTSPGFRNRGGFWPRPTPGGVPVEITSPGSRVMNW